MDDLITYKPLSLNDDLENNLSDLESLNELKKQNRNTILNDERPALESFIINEPTENLGQNSNANFENSNDFNATSSENLTQNLPNFQNEQQSSGDFTDQTTQSANKTSATNSQNMEAIFNNFFKPDEISITGSENLDRKIKENDLSLYDIYALKKMGFNPAELKILTNQAQNERKNAILSQMANLANNSGENSNQTTQKTPQEQEKLNLMLKKLSGDKDLEQLKDFNAAFENLNSIITNADETSGKWNALARKWSKATNHFILNADDENQQRISDEAMLYTNYANAMKLKSGGTAKERANIAEAINLGGLNADETRSKLKNVYDFFIQKQNNALKILKSKGYSDEAIFESLGENERNNFINNRKAYNYLKTTEPENFNSETYERIYKYGDYFNKDKGE